MNKEASLYEQLGGEPTIDRAVALFYGRILTDPDLMEFFEGVNIDQLKRHQKNFFTLALGGPNKYSGRDMRKAHEQLKLEDMHFDRIKQHLADTLTELGANGSQVETVMNTVEPLRAPCLNR